MDSQNIAIGGHYMEVFNNFIHEWVVAAEELYPCSPSEFGTSNCCKEAKYDVIEFGVFKSTPNKLVIHSWLVVLTDSLV